jgi:hypothetical protein
MGWQPIDVRKVQVRQSQLILIFAIQRRQLVVQDRKNRVQQVNSAGILLLDLHRLEAHVQQRNEHSGTREIVPKFKKNLN